MKLATEHIYLVFDIQNSAIQNVGQVEILIHKFNDIEKWKNPKLCEAEAVDYFKSKNKRFKFSKLTAIYSGDLIPSL